MHRSYLSFVSAKFVALSWIGALFGPLVAGIGFQDGRVWHSVVDVGLLALVVSSVRYGLVARRQRRVSDAVVHLYVPLVLLFSGALLAVPLLLLDSTGPIDACLDSGGSFNYETCTCDYQKSHPVRPSHDC